MRQGAVVKKAREAEARGEAVILSKKSLVLPMCQDEEERESGKGKHKASLLLLPMEKGKKRAKMVSLVVVTLKVESEEEEEDKACHLAVAIEASKAAPGGDEAGPSRQAEVPQDVGNWQQQEEEEEKAEVGPEATPQVHPWGKELPQ
ncbi:hypothetical protein C0993_005530 [Termitomyces sp. T159_Od127]|nr:hypothetical protein C0993_005530 [Termitomyces sp. T159_Od127]